MAAFISVASELKGIHMPVQELVLRPNPAQDDVQRTAFGYDVLARYIWKNWQEITQPHKAPAHIRLTWW